MASTPPHSPVTDELLPRWDTSSAATSVNRGSPRIAQRKARAVQRVGSGQPGNREPKLSSKALANGLGLLWIVVGAALALGCVTFFIGSFMMVRILSEISKARDFGGPLERIGNYGEFFSRLPKAGFTVGGGEPTITEGVTTYLWTVQPIGIDDLHVFSWQLDLKSNKIEPTENASLLLDMELGYITAGEARAYSFFDPNDSAARAIIDEDVSFFAPNNPNGWGKRLETIPPVQPALIDPTKRRRFANQAVEKTDEEKAAEEAAAAAAGGESPPAEGAETGGQEDQGGESEPPTEVVDPDAPPPDEGESGGGEEPPPADNNEDDGDATPVG